MRTPRSLHGIEPSTQVAVAHLLLTVQDRVGARPAGAFPALLVPRWETRRIDLIGPDSTVRGRPIVCAGFGDRMWIFGERPGEDRRNLGALLAFCGPADVGSVQFGSGRRRQPYFMLSGRRIQIDESWFDITRMTLAAMARQGQSGN